MKNILLIDDDNYLNDDLAYFIQEAGYKCTVYENAEKVLDNIDNLAEYDVIILDIMMRSPESLVVKDGYETGEEYFEMIHQRYPGKKIIIISAKDFSDMKIDFRGIKNIHIITKPCKVDYSDITDLI